jgi:hypothetical protein
VETSRRSTVAEYDMTTPEGRARRRAREITAFFWHLGTFVVINGFLWFVIREWSVNLWIIVPWGLALAFHGLATFLGPRGLEERLYNNQLLSERRREAVFEEEAQRKEMVR